MDITPSMKVSPKYTLETFIKSDTAKKLGLSNLPNEAELQNIKKIAEVVEKMESLLGPVTIVSGFRSKEVNEEVDGASGSKHLDGSAVDFYPKLQTPQKYWTDLISNVTLMPLLGEVSWKTHQGTIHITLPYGLTKGSARIADASGYYRNDSPIGKELLAKFGVNGNVPVASAGFGMGALMLGVGAFLLALVIKKKNNG